MQILHQKTTNAARVDSPSEKNTLIFLHITKTAGTTLRHILKNQFHPKSILTIQQNLENPDYNDILYDDFVNLTPAQKSSIQFMRGHFSFGIHHHLHRSFNYITILRDPVERLMSWYYFVRQNPENEGFKSIVDNSGGFEDFVLKGGGGPNSQVNMLITQEQADTNTDRNSRLDIAKENVEKFFSSVGFVEKFDESMILLKRTLGWNFLPVYTKHNVTKNRPKKSDLHQRTLDIIGELYWADFKLYEFLLKIFDDKIGSEGDSFQREVEKLKMLNYASTRSSALAVLGKLDEALDVLKTTLQIEPYSPDIYKEIGQLYYQKTDFINAMQSFLKAVELNPNDTETLAFCIALLERFGKSSEAGVLKQML